MSVLEDCGKPFYDTNYMAFYNALSSKYPNIKLIANCDLTPQKLPTQLYDYHIYTSAKSFYDQRNTFDSFDRNGPKIFNSEYAVTSPPIGNLLAALGEASWMTGLERNGDIVTTASYAPLFGNVYGSEWNPNAIMFNSSNVYGTPSYWLQVLWATSYSGCITGTVQTLNYTMSDNSIPVAVTKCNLTSESSSRHGNATTAYIHKIIVFG